MRAMCFLCVALRCYAFFVLWRIIIVKTERLKNEFIRNIDHPDMTFDEMKTSSKDKCLWKCSICGKEWQAQFKSRAGQKAGNERGCKNCANLAQGKRITKRAIYKNGCIADSSDLLNEWDWKNNTLNPYETPATAVDKAFWICSECNYHYEQRIVYRVKRNEGCPKCAGKVVELDNSMATLVPEIWDYIDTDYDDKPPTQYKTNSHDDIHLKCPNCGYKWVSHPYVFSKGHRCEACAGKVATERYNLKTVYPKIADLFLEEMNDIKATEVTPHSNKSYYFACGICGTPRKISVDKAVERGILCKKCSARYHTSFPQEAIYYYAIRYFGTDVKSRYLMNGNKAGELDIYIPKFNIGIEYDSYYFHKSDKKFITDRNKNEIAENNGIKLVRLIETNKNSNNKNNVSIGVRADDFELTNAIYKLFKMIDASIDYDISISRDRIEIFEQFYKTPIKNNLKKLYPQVVSDWDYNRNGCLKPEFFTAGSNCSVYWIGKDKPLQIRGVVQKYKRQTEQTKG